MGAEARRGGLERREQQSERMYSVERGAGNERSLESVEIGRITIHVGFCWIWGKISDRFLQGLGVRFLGQHTLYNFRVVIHL